jgi:hypothetical protein
LAHFLRFLTGNIDTQFAHSLDCLGIKLGSLTSSADSVKAITRQLAKERFGHLRPA